MDLTDNVVASATPRGWGRAWLGGVHLSVIGGLLTWVFLDPVFAALAEHRLQQLGFDVRHDPFYYVGPVADSWRGAALAIVATICLATWVYTFIQLMRGSPAQRSVLSWLLLVTVVAGWCAAANYWHRVAWMGKQSRLASEVQRFESYAQPLRTHWPQDDGELEPLGPFMAYPAGRPTVLLFLTTPELSPSKARVSAIERGVQGQIRFQLAGPEQGDWLEWHPGGSVPDSFVGGLSERFFLERSQRVAKGWYLVRYRVVNRASLTT